MAQKLDIVEGRERIRLNIGGQYFETFKSTLESIPNTRISALTSSDPSYDSNAQEYFFDRNPCLFPYILDAFREGEVNFPSSILATSIRTELSFWGLDEERLSESSWRTCSDWDAQQKTLSFIDESKDEEDSQERGTGHALWTFLEKPCSSIKATVWSAFYILMILLTIAVISARTLPENRSYKVVRGISYDDYQETTQDSTGFTVLKTIFFICALFFIIELVIRFAVCPSKLRFFISFCNDIDVLAIIPMIILGIIDISSSDYWTKNDLTKTFDYILAAISILRAIRILKVWRQSRNLRIIMLALKASFKELSFVMLMLVVGVAVFSTLIFYAESKSEETHFVSVPSAMWYSIVTLTTVGYGDTRPLTPFGKCVGGICAVCGIFIFLLSVPVFVNKFRIYDDHARAMGVSDIKRMSKAKEAEA